MNPNLQGPSRLTVLDDLLPEFMARGPAHPHASGSHPARPGAVLHTSSSGSGSGSDSTQTPKLGDAWVADLALMHHYTASTCLTLPRAAHAHIKAIWQVEIPRAGMSRPYLLRQTLAVAALHLAHIHPQERWTYVLRASTHQTEALAGMRDNLQDVSEEDNEILFATGSLLVIGSFAAFRYGRDKFLRQAGPVIDDMIGVFLLLQGMHSILNSALSRIHNGRFKDLFQVQTTDNRSPLLSELETQLRLLRHRLVGSHNTPKPDDVVIYSLDVFLDWLAHAAGSISGELRLVMTWPISLKVEYIDLLRSKDPAALTVLAHYCVAVWWAESTEWYMEGWGRNCLHSVLHCLDQSWKDLIQWPVASVLAPSGSRSSRSSTPSG